MDRNEFLAGVNRPGAFQRVIWVSNVKGAAVYKDRVLTKCVTATIRTGVDYANLSVNEGTETGALPWGEWAVFPLVVAHKATDYGRLYTLDGSLRTKYYVDCQETDRESFGEFLTPSARNAPRPNGGTITVKLENLEFLT